MRVIVPFATTHPKTRLGDVLDLEQRRAFARAMLRDVVEAIDGAGHDPFVLATAPIEVDAPVDVPVSVDARPLTPAVNAVLDDADLPVGVAAADLGLATSRTIRRLCDASGDVVVAPGRGGGTNALVVRHPAFRVDYHGASYLDHLRIASEIGASVRDVDSMRLAIDVDNPSDLSDLLIHGDGDAVTWLREAGFVLETNDGRVTVSRSE